MSNSFIYKLLIIFIISSFIVSCKKVKIETEKKQWGFYQPENFPSATYNFENNTQTYKRFELGRELFYDPILSLDSTISCATCHAQSHAFAAHNTALSEGVFHQFGTRNSPGIFNMAWSNNFMWDGGITNLEVMPIAPLTNPVEMGETLNAIIAKLQNSEMYQQLFTEAYGTESITDQFLLKALAQYMAMIISDNSKFDKVLRGEDAFTISEQLGYDLFQSKCVECHSGTLFTDYSFRNNGLDDNFSDEGRFKITQNPEDLGKFKVPSLRNVAVTYPYMHDGRYFTLDQVLNHYSYGIVQSETLDPLLSQNIPLSESDKSNLISFLKTLTDIELLGNGSLSQPKH